MTHGSVYVIMDLRKILLTIMFIPYFSATANLDKGAAMTLILQEASIGHIGRCPQEEYLLALNLNNRILFHKKLGTYKEKKIAFPLVRNSGCQVNYLY